MMEERIRDFAAIVSALIDLAMIVVIVIGTALAFFRIADRAIRRRALATAAREIWLHYAGWIVLALEFALAADLIDTVIAPSWEQIGQLGAIAAIRIALGFFLGKDIDEYRDMRSESDTPSETSDRGSAERSAS